MVLQNQTANVRIRRMANADIQDRRRMFELLGVLQVCNHYFMVGPKCWAVITGRGYKPKERKRDYVYRRNLSAVEQNVGGGFPPIPKHRRKYRGDAAQMRRSFDTIEQWNWEADAAPREARLWNRRSCTTLVSGHDTISKVLIFLLTSVFFLTFCGKKVRNRKW